MAKNSFVLYKSDCSNLLDFTNEELGEFFRQIISYQTNGLVPEFTDIKSKVIFQMFKRSFDNDSQKYEASCLKRSENGKLGGQASSSKRKQIVANGSKCLNEVANGSKSKQLQPESVSVSVSVSDPVPVSVYDTESEFIPDIEYDPTREERNKRLIAFTQLETTEDDRIKVEEKFREAMQNKLKKLGLEAI